jgi:Calcineurin-like phosphoesterase
MKLKKRMIFFFLIFYLIVSLTIPLSAQQKVKIALWGDSRENRDNATAEITHTLLYKITDWDFQVHTGDFTHDGKEESWQRTLHYPGIDSIFARGKFYFCTSNHDAKDADSKANWDKHTAGILPENSADNSTHFYAVHKGNVDIIFCDGYFTDSTVMQNWLDNYLSKINPNDWIIGVWHNVSYGDLTYKESYLNTCQPWINSLYKHGCKFIFNGHAHVYVRTKPLLPDEKLDKNGIVTIINGTGGASWKDPVNSNPEIAYTPSERSFPTITFLTFDGDKAHLETVDCRPGKNLKVIDQKDYTK